MSKTPRVRLQLPKEVVVHGFTEAQMERIRSVPLAGLDGAFWALFAAASTGLTQVVGPVFKVYGGNGAEAMGASDLTSFGITVAAVSGMLVIGGVRLTATIRGKRLVKQCVSLMGQTTANAGQKKQMTVSTTSDAGASKGVDTGMRRHDGGEA